MHETKKYLALQIKIFKIMVMGWDGLRDEEQPNA
jgi:hypothetical protein